VQLRPELERDGRGLTELEFALTMLIELDIVKWETVRPFIHRFHKLNIKGDGRLGQGDLKMTQMADLEENSNLGKNFGARRGSMAVEARRVSCTSGHGPVSVASDARYVARQTLLGMKSAASRVGFGSKGPAKLGQSSSAPAITYEESSVDLSKL